MNFKQLASSEATYTKEKKKVFTFLASLFLFTLFSWQSAEAASFTALGDLTGGPFFSTARDLSSDGSVVVGYSQSTSGLEAFRWTLGGGMVGLGDLAGGSFQSFAFGTSDDGSVVVGGGLSASGTEAYRWTSGGGMVGIGDLSGGTFASRAFDTSSDGSVLVGLANSASGQEPMRWTSGGGMVGLGDLAGGTFSGNALGVSSDGSVVVGGSNSASGLEAFRWTSGGGMVGLGDLAGGSFASLATGTSSDGSVLAGYGNSASGQEAFRWTSGGGMVGLGDLAGGSFQSVANDISGDGSVVAGFGFSALGQEAFIWDAVNGMRNLKTVLVGLGIDLTGYTLTNADGLSADGTIIVGQATGPSGSVAFLADISVVNTLTGANVTAVFDSPNSYLGDNVSFLTDAGDIAITYDQVNTPGDTVVAFGEANVNATALAAFEAAGWHLFPISGGGAGIAYEFSKADGLAFDAGFTITVKLDAAVTLFGLGVNDLVGTYLKSDGSFEIITGTYNPGNQTFAFNVPTGTFSGFGVAVQPEPATLFLLGSGLFGLFRYRKKLIK